MKTREKILTIVSILVFSCASNAQDTSTPPAPIPAYKLSYSTAIGFRAGETSGLTIKQFISPASALEGIVGFRNSSLGFTLLYERYVQSGAPGLRWYYGGGGHAIAGASRTYYFDYGPAYYTTGDMGIGIDGTMGIEYKIPTVPFAFSFDLKPFVEFSNNGFWFFAIDPGLGFKVAF